MELTFAQIKAAQDNDLEATAAVISATASRVAILASKAASRMTRAGQPYSFYLEEFSQVGRIAVWEALPRFTGDSVDAFMRFVYTTVEGKMLDSVRSERHQAAGVDQNVAKVFAAMIAAADGDAYEAEKLAQVLPPKGRRLSADLANAARLAWQGAASIDRHSGPDGGTLADTLAELPAEPDDEREVRPKVGHGAALEALSVLQRYADVVVQRMTPGEFAANLPALVAQLEDCVVIPRDPAARRYVLDAMAILRSAVSTATDGDLIEELRDVADERADERAEKIQRVRACLNSLGEAQRKVLANSFGIDGAADFGWGDGCDLAGLCEFLGMTYDHVKVYRSKARKAFAKRYVAAVSLTNPNLGSALEAAAAQNLTNRGRK